MDEAAEIPSLPDAFKSAVVISQLAAAVKAEGTVHLLLPT
jgi:hypothetical protein